MMAVAALLGSWMAWARGLWIFPFVVAWAVHGIGARYTDMPLVGPAADPIADAAITVGVALFILVQRPHATTPHEQVPSLTEGDALPDQGTPSRSV